DRNAVSASPGTKDCSAVTAAAPTVTAPRAQIARAFDRSPGTFMIGLLSPARARSSSRAAEPRFLASFRNPRGAFRPASDQCAWAAIMAAPPPPARGGETRGRAQTFGPRPSLIL